jgi:hypothetical protein
LLIFFSFCYFFFSLLSVVNLLIITKEWGELLYRVGFLPINPDSPHSLFMLRCAI